MKANFSYVIAIIALAAVCWLGAGLLWGWRGPVLDIARFWVLLIGSLLLGWALVHSTRKLAAGVWMAAGLLLMVLLSLPFSTFTNIFPWQGDGFFLSSISFTLIVLFCAALIVAALLIASGLDLTSAWRRADSPAGGEEQRRVSPRNLGYVSLFLGALLLVQVGYKFFWFMVWDSTYDPLEYLWLFFPILAACFAGAILVFALPGHKLWVGFGYAFLVSGLLVGVTSLAGQVDFRQLTAARGERLSQAIEAYYAGEGSYPQSLRQLTPRYALTLPEPVILYGEGWCYDGGDGFYRLGYVNRLHWSDPRLIGQVHSAQGAAPDLPPMCSQEVAAIKERFPEYPFAYWGGE